MQNNVARFLTSEGDRKPPSKAEIAWSESIIQNAGLNQEKYNPDELIGRKGFGIYKRMMQDEQVKAVVRFKRDAITSRDWFLEYDPDTKLSESEKTRRIRFFNQMLRNVDGSFGDAMNGIMSAIYNGFSMTEKVFDQIDFEGNVFWQIRAFKLRPFDTFHFKVDPHGNILEVIQRMDGQEQRITMDKFIWFVVNPDIDDQYGGSELREAYDSWYYKSVFNRFWAIWIEKHATGYFWVMPTSEDVQLNVDSEEWKLIKAIIEGKTAASSFAFPRKMDVQMNFPANQVAFKEAVNHHDLGIAKALLVPNLLGVTVQSATGSFAQSSTQLEAFLWTLDHDASRLEDCINEKVMCHVGDINFGDGLYPKFKLKPISESKKLEVISKWKELVGSDAVSTTNSDQQHLRELLGFPAMDEEKLARIDKDILPEFMEVLKGYMTGSINEASAIKILSTIAPLDEKEVKELIKDLEVKEEEPPTTPSGDDTNEDDDDPEADGDDSDDLPDGEEEDDDEDDTFLEQTPRSKGYVEVDYMTKQIMKAAFASAKRRTDFAKIQQDSERIEEDEVVSISKVFANEVGKIVEKIKEEKLGTDENREVELINNLKMNRKRIRNTVEGMLRRGWALGQKTAEDELQRTQLSKTKINMERLADRAADFFNARSFQVAGKFSDDAMSDIKNILFNGIKGSKSTDEIVKEIYTKFGRDGKLTPEDVEEALGEAFSVENPNARLKTLIRTNTFEAINEARHDFYTDPDLDGFVVALEYSSTLDSRTTNICRHLDDRKYPTDSEIWNTYRPPNHFNCRAVTIPLLSTDDFELTSEPPEINPQEGFS